MVFNVTGGGGGGNGCALTVTAPAGVTVTASKDGKTKTKVADASGVAVFKGLTTGLWTVSISDGVQTSSTTVSITADYAVQVSFSTVPEFTYTGDYQIVNDSDTPIATSQGDWKIRFLTSGTLAFTNLNGAENGIDVFLVGGGGSGSTRSSSTENYGGGGAGGYTENQKNVKVVVGTQYEITIGAGGASVNGDSSGSTGGNTSAFGIMASGGEGGGISNNTGSSVYNGGGNGGSGGGSGGGSSRSGGVDGSDGSGTHPGHGQGTTTREFASSVGKLYSTGGDGGATSATSGSENTGDGGDGARGGASGSGGSGIVIIRNAREVA